MKASKAPDGRINISYQLAGEEREVKELPLRMLVIGDFTGRDSDTPVADRMPVAVNQLNFDTVMAKQKIEVELHGVQTHAEADGSASIADLHARPLTLQFRNLADFHPDQVLAQLTDSSGGKSPQLQALAQMLKLREALVALKGPMGTRASFRKAMEDTIKDKTQFQALMAALGVAN